MMKQHIEIVTKVKTIKEIHTRTGKWMYSFSIPIVKMEGEEQLTEWMQVTVLQDKQRPDLLDAKEVHFIGQLTIKAAYKNYPQSVGIFGFYIEPVLSQVYRHRKVKKNTSEDATQAPTASTDVPTQAQRLPDDGYENDFLVQSSEIPF